MDNRKRNVQLIIRVTEDERKFIEEKMKLMPTMNLSAYLNHYGSAVHFIPSICFEIGRAHV